MLRHSASNLKKVDVVHCSGETYIPHGSFGVLTLLLFLRFCFYYILREFLNFDGVTLKNKCIFGLFH